MFLYKNLNKWCIKQWLQYSGKSDLTVISVSCISISDKKRSRGQKGVESGRGKRYSYKLPQEYNVETVVVADPTMVSYHGADAARRFILTILNMVGNHMTFQ